MQEMGDTRDESEGLLIHLVATNAWECIFAVNVQGRSISIEVPLAEASNDVAATSD